MKEDKEIYDEVASERAFPALQVQSMSLFPAAFSFNRSGIMNACAEDIIMLIKLQRTRKKSLACLSLIEKASMNS